MAVITIKKSKRKTLSLEVKEDCTVTVHAPLYLSDREIDKFIKDHSAWISEKLELQKKRLERSREIDEHERELRRRAEQTLPVLVSRFSAVTGLVPASVKITSAKTRFGSCSGKNAVCFSWRLMAYPMPAIEYVVLHELAHIRHHNHSAAFYALIEKYMPDYKERRKMLS